MTDLTKSKPNLNEVTDAVQTLIRWIGDDPTREGLIDTPLRVYKSYDEFYKGYDEKPLEVISKTFEEVEGYNEIVMLTNIEFSSHCEHHMMPIIGVAHIAYLPNKKIVGISKLARLLETYAKRLQTQETMTVDIADTLNKGLEPLGVAVIIEAEHQCMSIRGVKKQGVMTVTSQILGEFKTNKNLYNQFFNTIKFSKND